MPSFLPTSAEECIQIASGEKADATTSSASGLVASLPPNLVCVQSTNGEQLFIRIAVSKQAPTHQSKFQPRRPPQSSARSIVDLSAPSNQIQPSRMYPVDHDHNDIDCVLFLNDSPQPPAATYVSPDGDLVFVSQLRGINQPQQIGIHCNSAPARITQIAAFDEVVFYADNDEEYIIDVGTYTAKNVLFTQHGNHNEHAERQRSASVHNEKFLPSVQRNEMYGLKDRHMAMNNLPQSDFILDRQAPSSSVFDASTEQKRSVPVSVHVVQAPNVQHPTAAFAVATDLNGALVPFNGESTKQWAFMEGADYMIHIENRGDQNAQIVLNSQAMPVHAPPMQTPMPQKMVRVQTETDRFGDGVPDAEDRIHGVRVVTEEAPMTSHPYLFGAGLGVLLALVLICIVWIIYELIKKFNVHSPEKAAEFSGSRKTSVTDRYRESVPNQRKYKYMSVENERSNPKLDYMYNVDELEYFSPKSATPSYKLNFDYLQN